MDILFVSHNLNLEGAPKFLFRLARSLSQNYSIALLSHSPGTLVDSFNLSGIPVMDLGGEVPSPGEGAFNDKTETVARLICSRLGSPRLVIFNTVDCLWASALARSHGVPSVGIIHESIDPFIYFHIQTGNPVPYLDLLRAVSTTVFVSEKTRQLYIGFLESSETQVIQNGIDLSDYDQAAKRLTPAEARSRLGVAPHEIMVVQIGTVCQRKGQIITMRAAVEVWRRRPDLTVKFFFVGDRGANADEVSVSASIQATACRVNKSDNIALIRETCDIAQYLLAADIFVFPSLNESFPLATLEAMAFRLPIVASRVFGLVEQIEDGWNGFLIAAGDADALADKLLELSDSVALRKALGSNGRKKVEEFYQEDLMVARYGDIVRRYV
ncbi:glycosyltransferase family 4 protein [Candidatus Nitrospira bockiana]